MSRFTVVWDRAVEVQFIEAWIAGDERLRSFLTEIANWIDSNLATDPGQMGSLHDKHRLRIVPVPTTDAAVRVSAVFEVAENDRLVRVTCLTIRKL